MYYIFSMFGRFKYIIYISYSCHNLHIHIQIHMYVYNCMYIYIYIFGYLYIRIIIYLSVYQTSAGAISWLGQLTDLQGASTGKPAGFAVRATH